MDVIDAVAQVRLLEKARCNLIGASDTFSEALSDVTFESVEGVSIETINDIINQMQEEIINSTKSTSK